MNPPRRFNDDDDREEMETRTREIFIPNTRNAPVTVTWENPAKTILRYDFVERWTWKDIYAAKNIGDAMVESVPHFVGLMYVLPPNATLPENAIPNVRTLIKNAHKRVYMSVVVSNNVYVKTIYNVLKQVYKPLTKNFMHADNADKARTLLTDTYPHRR